MSEILITNCVGTFVLKGKQIEDKRFFKSAEEFHNQKIIAENEKQLLAKYPNAKKPANVIFPQHKEFLSKFYVYHIEHAKKMCKEAIRKEHLIMQAGAAIKDMEKVINPLAKRLQEWYALYCPELNEFARDQEEFVVAVLTKKKEDILLEQHIPVSMGAEIAAADRAMMESLAVQLQHLFAEKRSIESYIEKALQDTATNLSIVAGPTLAAELLGEAGSLERLAKMPASTIQMIGAENALFRYMRGQGRCPKHGMIINHPLLANTKASQRGRVARRLAGVIALAAKVDYFKGDPYVGYKLKEHLELNVAELLRRKEKAKKIVHHEERHHISPRVSHYSSQKRSSFGAHGRTEHHKTYVKSSTQRSHHSEERAHHTNKQRKYTH
ncbi:hypothetical protein HZA99_02130 [Candidatus Woesearchaeota archaeon]|nr:hypothetical protein [Candidatus Woesearchaeota archaeon]